MHRGLSRFCRMGSPWVLLFSLSFAGAPSSSASAAEGAPPAAGWRDSNLPKLEFEKYTLPNGLEIVLHEDHRSPLVAVNVWYHVGSKDEPKGRNGFAHLFEHMMFQGSRNVGEDMFFKYLERAGATDRNGTTNNDRTNYFEAVPANQLELVLWLESDRMAFLLDHADKATFEGQREVVKNERRQNYENQPYGMTWHHLMAALYPPEHPYHLTTIGTPEDLDAATLSDVQGFFRTYYVPNNATLVVAGDIDKAKAKELVAKYFGPIARGATPPVKTAPTPVTLAGEKRLKLEANVELSRLLIAWPTPQALHKDDLTLDVLGEVLEKGKTSRLYKRLVHELQLAQSVSAGENSGQLWSSFLVTVTLQKGKSVDEALREVDAEIDKLRKAPPEPAELERAKTGLISNHVFDSERVSTRADRFNFFNQYTGDPGYLPKVIQAYGAITPKDLTDAVNKWLPKDRRVVMTFTPNPKAPRAGRLVESGQ